MPTSPADRVPGVDGGDGVGAAAEAWDAAEALDHAGAVAPPGADAPDAFDLLVIGAGPAGLAATVAAARAGYGRHVRVALLDAAPRAGGQFWRHRSGDDGGEQHDWTTFRRLVASVDRLRRAGTVVHLAEHAAWHLERAGDGFTAHVVHAGQAREVRGRGVVIATGAYDRQLPFPGWTLPGVVTAGAAQALLKAHGVVVGRRVVVAGTGPFLLPVGAGLADGGARVVAVLEAGRPTAALRHPVALARNADRLVEAGGYLARLARHRVPYRSRRAVVAAHGDGAVEEVTTAALDRDWRVVPGSERRIACDAVAVGYGFTPQVELAADLGCAMRLDADGSLVVTADDEQRTSVDGAFVAGEACGVGGQALALVEGRLAGTHAAAWLLGTGPHADAVERLVRRRARLRSFAALLPLAWPIRPGWRTWTAPDTLACRCEEVPVAAIREAVATLGATDARGARLFARAGMGRCQGRVCGYATASLVAEAAGREPTTDDMAATLRRPVAWPITLGTLARDPVRIGPGGIAGIDLDDPDRSPDPHA